MQLKCLKEEIQKKIIFEVLKSSDLNFQIASPYCSLTLLSMIKINLPHFNQ